MAKMLRKSAKSWGAGCGCSRCERGGCHRAIQHQARRRESREWMAEVEAEMSAEEAAHEFNMNNAIGILFGDVDPK